MFQAEGLHSFDIHGALPGINMRSSYVKPYTVELKTFSASHPSAIFLYLYRNTCSSRAAARIKSKEAFAVIMRTEIGMVQ